jgi:hypothetical protein
MKQGDTAIAGMVVTLRTKGTSGFVEVSCQLHAHGSMNPHPASLVSYKKSEPLSSAVKMRPNWPYDLGYPASVTTMDLVSTDARKSASAGASGFANET